MGRDQGELEPDVIFLNRALEPGVSRQRRSIQRACRSGGFSDGATYALTLGLINGDLFRRIVAFSPGFVVTGAGVPHGKAKFFISHGTRDDILPIDRCSRTSSRPSRRPGTT